MPMMDPVPMGCEVALPAVDEAVDGDVGMEAFVTGDVLEPVALVVRLPLDEPVALPVAAVAMPVATVATVPAAT